MVVDSKSHESSKEWSEVLGCSEMRISGMRTDIFPPRSRTLPAAKLQTLEMCNQERFAGWLSTYKRSRTVTICSCNWDSLVRRLRRQTGQPVLLRHSSAFSVPERKASPHAFRSTVSSRFHHGRSRALKRTLEIRSARGVLGHAVHLCHVTHGSRIGIPNGDDPLEAGRVFKKTSARRGSDAFSHGFKRVISWDRNHSVLRDADAREPILG